MTRPSSFSKIKRRPVKKQVVKPAGAQLKLPFSVQFPEFKPAKYGYVNARTKAMKGLLLDKEFLLEMCRMRTVPEVVEMLERTHYKSELVSNSMHYHGSDLVQIASMLYFAGMIEKLGGMIPESDKKAFNLVLMKWDISNLKAVLNGRRYGEKYPDIAPFLVPVGSLKEEELSAILEGSGEAAFSAFIRSEIGRKLIENKLGSSAEIEKMFRGDLTSEGTMRIETALDALLYNGYVNMENELGAEFEPIVRVVRKEVDLKNALIVARLKKNGIDDARKIKSYLMKGGFKSIEYYDRIIELKSAEDVLKAIAADFDLKSVPSDLVELEVFIGKRLVKEKLKAFYRSVLSIGVVFGFLFLLEEESNNLRKITICKEFGVPEDKVSSMLVFPN